MFLEIEYRIETPLFHHEDSDIKIEIFSEDSNDGAGNIVLR